ncbi:Thiol-specific monooxygenase [Fulvia fulva]|uniref:Thiol-specific monooxygenase n=1 Tax=Passalora fulva TaxID=5499 RepID=A0A9Q8PJ52_PASFU|nr:Thiol-specific monooxygenase [Fulvia fulva]UJO23377.1 Thiol-specific monooxygenase [Fulvia fulva]
MVKPVAIIGAGASGAAAAAALKAEDYHTKITIFERRETAGGTWIYDDDPGELPLLPGLLPPEADKPLPAPTHLPTTTEPTTQNRFDRTPIYAELTTNVPDVAMSFTKIPFPYGPFVPHHVPKQYIENYFSWHQTDSSLVLNTTVEDLVRLPKDRWRLVLRVHDASRKVDEWWEEEFDAVILANGHYSVPFIPNVTGLEAYLRKFPGRVEHSKTYRTPKAYGGQKVVVVGNSGFGRPIYNSRRSQGRCDGAKPEPGVAWLPVIEEFRSDGSILFADGTVLRDIDKVIYCTGYKVSHPFWNSSKNGRHLYDYATDRIVNNYQHTFIRDFPTLAFIGFPRVLTFRSFEYQAIAIARLWSNRSTRPLPHTAEQQSWEEDRAQMTKAERRKFHQIDWDNGESMDWFRWLFEFAGLPQLEGHGRCPPVLDTGTRWAIEHIRKYPGPQSAGCGEVQSFREVVDEEGREVVERHQDNLSFL